MQKRRAAWAARPKITPLRPRQKLARQKGRPAPKGRSWFIRPAVPPFDAAAPAGLVLHRITVNGAEGQTRTADTYIFSVVLYRLSYLGTAGILSVAASGGQAP